MPRLYRQDTGLTLASISVEDLDFLCGALELEGPDDRDLHITRATIDYLRESGAADRVIGMLESALGEASEVDIAWDDPEA